MSTATDFRDGAVRYRKLAEADNNPAARDYLLGYARHYEMLATLVEDGGEPHPGPAVQLQPVQQQQKKKRD